MLLGCTLFESAQGSRSQAIAHRTPEHRSSSLCRPAPVLGPQHHWPNHPPVTRQRGSALSAMLLEPGGHREHPKCSALSAALSPASSTAPAAVLCPWQYGVHRILPAMPLGQELLGVHPPAPPQGPRCPASCSRSRCVVWQLLWARVGSDLPALIGTTDLQEIQPAAIKFSLLVCLKSCCTILEKKGNQSWLTNAP